jgi:hypothetical protein
MRQLKVGDRVRLLHPIDDQESPGFTSDMYRYVGKIDTIYKIDPTYGHCRITNCMWWWNVKWLRLIDDKFLQYKQNLLKE